MEKFLAEDKQPFSVIDPQSLAGAVTGGRLSMENVKRVAFIIDVGAGTSTTAHGFVLKQHDAASSGNTHDLSVDNPYYHKVGSATKFTKVSLDSALATYDLHTLIGQNKAVVVLEVLAEQLRSDCAWVSLNNLAAGGTLVGCVVALADHCKKPAYEQEL